MLMTMLMCFMDIITLLPEVLVLVFLGSIIEGSFYGKHLLLSVAYIGVLFLKRKLSGLCPVVLFQYVFTREQKTLKASN